MLHEKEFVSGSVLTLVGIPQVYLIDLIFFIGSIFFTAAGYGQYYQFLNAPDGVDGSGQTVQTKPRKFLGFHPLIIGFWTTFPQFLGTLAFNATTFRAFFDAGILRYDIRVWVPDYVGSVLFLISGISAVIEFCHQLVCWQRHNISWWIVMINFVGCVAFMISAYAAFVRPNPNFGNLATWATIFTLIGAVCFFVGAYLMWPEMSAEKQAN